MPSDTPVRRSKRLSAEATPKRSRSKTPKSKSDKERSSSRKRVERKAGKSGKKENIDAGTERFSKENSFFEPPPVSDILPRLFRFRPWLLYPEQNGSLGGFFDFVPAHLRVGSWFPLAPVFIAVFTAALYAYKPSPLSFEPTFPEPYSLYFYLDVFFCFNNSYVLYLILGKAGPAPLCTYTIWSWCILTFRCLSSVICSLFPGLPLLPCLSEFFRFPALVAATLTFIVWNFVLAPIMYFVFFKTTETKRNFIVWNLQFQMQEIHTLNYPIAVTNAVLSTGARALTTDDLWAAFSVIFAYSMLYLFILDRLGVHLYPVFSPRSKFSVIAWSVVFLLYGVTWVYWNEVVAIGRIESFMGGVTVLWEAAWSTRSAIAQKVLG